MRRLATSILLLAIAGSASAQPAAPAPTPAPSAPAVNRESAAPVSSGGLVAAVPGMGRVFATRHLSCDEVRFVIPVAAGVSGIAASPESVVVIENEGGTTGVRFIVDRRTGETVGVQTWKELAGLTMTTIPAAARVDWVNCQDAQPAGGIVVEWVDARTMIPPADPAPAP